MINSNYLLLWFINEVFSILESGEWTNVSVKGSLIGSLWDLFSSEVLERTDRLELGLRLGITPAQPVPGLYSDNEDAGRDNIISLTDDNSFTNNIINVTNNEIVM